MALLEHIRELQKGSENWNQWRENHPEIKPDLSGLDLSTNSDLKKCLITSLDPIYQSPKPLNFSNTDLRGSNLQGCRFAKCDFTFADLSGSNISNCMFEECEFSISEKEILSSTNNLEDISRELENDFRKKACRLNNVQAFETKFVRLSLSFCDLTRIFVDEETEFDRVSVVGTRITRAVLDSLKNNGGLIAGRIRQMVIVDDVATLRQIFSGFWNKIHWFFLSIFLAPYVYFLSQQWVMSKIGSDSFDDKNCSPILYNMFRFICSGGQTWKEFRPSVLPILFFVFTLVFNLVRFSLLAKTLTLEHQKSVQGYFPDFRLQGFWGKVLYFYKLLAIVALLVVVVHTIMFLMMPVPV